MTQEILQLLFQSFVITLQRLVVDHLPGGMYNSVVDPQIIQETKSVPNTNVTPERDFAVLDRLMTQKPNATYIALEALLLYSHNKWLENKTIEERKRLMHAARTLTSVHRANFRKRRVGLGDSTIVIHCRDSRSTIVMMIVLFTIVIVVDMIFE